MGRKKLPRAWEATVLISSAKSASKVSCHRIRNPFCCSCTKTQQIAMRCNQRGLHNAVAALWCRKPQGNIKRTATRTATALPCRSARVVNEQNNCPSGVRLSFAGAHRIDATSSTPGPRPTAIVGGVVVHCWSNSSIRGPSPNRCRIAPWIRDGLRLAKNCLTTPSLPASARAGWAWCMAPATTALAAR